MKICIAGGRDFDNYDVLSKVVDQIIAGLPAPITIVSGKAKGADSLGEKYAAEHGLPTLIFPADWKKHGRGAGPIRNAQMADEADLLIAFWDGVSRGTANMIGQMQRRGKPYKVFDYSGEPGEDAAPGPSLCAGSTRRGPGASGADHHGRDAAAHSGE